jgi:hypothetical protein
MNEKINNNFSFFKALGIFLFLMGFSACDRNVNEEIIEYVIINDSDYDIEIVPIKSINYNNPKNHIFIRNNDMFSESRLWNERFDGGQGFSTFLATDSINIIIGDQRKIIYSTNINNGLSNCDNSRNLLLTPPEIGNNRVEYIFTNDDFDCAIICQNECL